MGGAAPRSLRRLGSTYRLQLRPGDLDWAAGRLAYLSRLGANKKKKERKKKKNRKKKREIKIE
jgi:hypothetical protein